MTISYNTAERDGESDDNLECARGDGRNNSERRYGVIDELVEKRLCVKVRV